MAVPTWKQTASKLDAFAEAVKLRHIITQMIMRNFGLKREKYDAIVGRQVREKYPELKSLIAKIDAYQNEVEKARLLTEYPEWIIEKVRDNLFRYSSDLVSNIAAANEILCRTQNEFVKRILLEDDAIGDIARIRQEVLFIEEFFNIDLSRYMEYSEQLELTKNYLYRWKKSTVRDYDEFLHPEKKASRLEKDFPERIDPAERRHRIERGSERDDISRHEVDLFVPVGRGNTVRVPGNDAAGN